MLWPAYAACAVLSARHPRLLCPLLRLLRLSRRPPPSPALLPQTLDAHTALLLGRALQVLDGASSKREVASAEAGVARVLGTAASGATAADIEAAVARRGAGWRQAGVLVRAVGAAGWAGALGTVVPALMSLRRGLMPLLRALPLPGGSRQRWGLAYYGVLHLSGAAGVAFEEGRRGLAVALAAVGCLGAWGLMVLEPWPVGREGDGESGDEEIVGEDDVEVTDVVAGRSMVQSRWSEGLTRRQRKIRSLSRYFFMAVTSACPALAFSSRTLGFYSSMFFFVGLCSAEDWTTPSDPFEDSRLAGPLPCSFLWILKCGIQHFTPASVRSNFAAFDVGVSIFGPLSLNFVTLARSRGQIRGKVICMMEALLGVAIGSTELVTVATLFLVPFTVAEIVKVSISRPVDAFALSSFAIFASASLSREENRERLAQLIQSVLHFSVVRPLSIE